MAAVNSSAAARPEYADNSIAIKTPWTARPAIELEEGAIIGSLLYWPIREAT